MFVESRFLFKINEIPVLDVSGRLATVTTVEE